MKTKEVREWEKERFELGEKLNKVTEDQDSSECARIKALIAINDRKLAYWRKIEARENKNIADFLEFGDCSNKKR